MLNFGGVHFYRLQSFQIADTNEKFLKMVSVTTLAAVRSFFDPNDALR